MGGTASGPPAWPWREGAGLPVGRGRGSRSWSRTPGCAGSVLLLVLGRGRGDSVLHAEAAHEEVDDGPVQVLPEGGAVEVMAAVRVDLRGAGEWGAGREKALGLGRPPAPVRPASRSPPGGQVRDTGPADSAASSCSEPAAWTRAQGRWAGPHASVPPRGCGAARPAACVLPRHSRACAQLSAGPLFGSCPAGCGPPESAREVVWGPMPQRARSARQPGTQGELRRRWLVTAWSHVVRTCPSGTQHPV